MVASDVHSCPTLPQVFLQPQHHNVPIPHGDGDQVHGPALLLQQIPHARVRVLCREEEEGERDTHNKVLVGFGD